MSPAAPMWRWQARAAGHGHRSSLVDGLRLLGSGAPVRLGNRLRGIATLVTPPLVSCRRMLAMMPPIRRPTAP
jgi:hypothetical protein